MNDFPPPLPPPQAKPFTPEKISGGGGCQKPMLVGCGLVALLLGIAAVVFVVKAQDVLTYAMNRLRAEVVAHLPEDTGEAERQQVEAGFDAAIARIRGGAIDPASLQEMQKKLTATAASAGSGRLTREELAGLIAALDKFNQKASDGPAVVPAGPGGPVPAGPEVAPAESSRPPAP